MAQPIGILRKPDNKITESLTEAEKALGVDLKLTDEGDLEINNLNDFKLVAGGQNAAQAAILKLFIEPGGLLYHPAIGTDLQIGEKTTNAFELQTQIIRSLSQDPRFENVNATVTVDGNTIFVDARITLTGTGVEVPLQFAVVR